MRYELSDFEWTAIKPMRAAPDMTSSQPTIWHSSNLHQSEFGCVLLSPRPKSPLYLKAWHPMLSINPVTGELL